MPIRREAIYDGDRELRRTARRFGEDFRQLRLRANATQAAVGDAVGVDRSVITRIERGDTNVSAAIRSRACALLGADFRLQLYPERAAMLVDEAQARIVERLLRLRDQRWRPTVEAPVPGPWRRSVDVRLDHGLDVVLMEIESRVLRLEQLVRELHGKRDAVAAAEPARRVHVVLVLPPTHHHRDLVREHSEVVRAAFPVPPGPLRDALERGEPWPGDGILWVPGGP